MEEDVMRKTKLLQKGMALLALALLFLSPAHAGDKTDPAGRPVQMTVTLRVLGENKRMPEVTREDIVVKQGKERLHVTGWRPVAANHGGIDLFLLIDDAASPSVGSQFGDLRQFILSQPPNTAVGVGYMRNGSVQVVQDFTTDHSLAARVLRLPFASSGAYGSPYLSVIDLMKRWPQGANRREVVMISDGIDRFRGGPRHRGLGPISPDVDAASRVAQRTGTTIHSIFTRGVGRLGNNYWEITNGQNAMAKLSNETGGQSYSLGPQNAVSFRPYLEDIQTSLDNKYVLEFRAMPGKKSGLQYVRLTTEVAGVELNAADSVWVKAN
jgi:hypothetical protein